MDLTRIPRKRATDEVYEAMRQAIITRVFKPGERLQVEEISQKLGVSLTPVRHALQQLSTEGLIEIHPRSGTYVSTVSAEDIEETFEFRCALEASLPNERSPESARNRSAASVSYLSNWRSRSTAKKSLKEHERANSELHQTIIDAVRQPQDRRVCMRA